MNLPQKRGSDSYFSTFETNKLHTSKPKRKKKVPVATKNESGTKKLTARICHSISLNSEQDVAMETIF